MILLKERIQLFVEGSPTHHSILKKIVEASKLKLKTLKSLSTARWACCLESVDTKQIIPAYWTVCTRNKHVRLRSALYKMDVK